MPAWQATPTAPTTAHASPSTNCRSCRRWAGNILFDKVSLYTRSMHPSNAMHDMKSKLASVSIILALSGCAVAPPLAPTVVTRGDYAVVQKYGSELIERA